MLVRVRGASHAVAGHPGDAMRAGLAPRPHRFEYGLDQPAMAARTVSAAVVRAVAASEVWL